MTDETIKKQEPSKMFSTYSLVAMAFFLFSSGIAYFYVKGYKGSRKQVRFSNVPSDNFSTNI